MSTRTQINAQAAAWISRLSADDRTAAVDAACREWLNADAQHRATFEIANRMWEDASTLPVSLAARIGRRELSAARASPRPFLRWAAAAGVALAVFAGTVLYFQRPQFLQTRTGQQLTVPLEDGSRLILNTETQVQVRFDEHVRRIELESGEALFDVAKDSVRPFIVRAGDREITALGTQFIVRHDETQTAVTLVDGKISVDTPRAAAAAAPATILSPGERMTIARQHAAVVDRPTIDAMTAWRKGEIIFENTPLATAIEEMNRYSTRKLRLGEGVSAQMPVSGLFRSGDAGNFALALTNTHPIEAIEHGNEIVLIRPGA